MKKYKSENPIIIIAAARSGTKMLRSALKASPEIVAFPYDINYIWKFGNFQIDHDELTPSDLNENITDYIHRQFFKILKNQKHKKIVEKTVSNSLRVDFVKAVFPGCKIIHLIRDGRDVAESSKRSWKAPLDIKYITKKALSFPIKDARKYLFQYLINNLTRFSYNKNKAKTWGPRFKGIDEAVKKYSLIETCGIQWLRCVKSTLNSLEKLNSEEYIQVKYEDIVSNPTVELRKIADFLEIQDFDSMKRFAMREITDKNIGKWKINLSDEEKELLIPHIRSILIKLNYSQ